MTLSRLILLLFVMSSLAGCGEDEAQSVASTPAPVASVDACSLVTQAEVDSLFDTSPGPGRTDSPHASIQGCVWPADGVPKFILQVLKAPDDVAGSIDPGDGYRVMKLDGLSGDAAVAIQEANPKFGLKEGVAILGIVSGDRMVTLAPVLLSIQEGTPRFETLKQVADSVAGRL